MKSPSGHTTIGCNITLIPSTFSLDEQSFQTFATYCGLALHHAKVNHHISHTAIIYVAHPIYGKNDGIC
jgi:hypothetical protein